MTKVSVITTERNEADSIAEFIESIMSQSLRADEIVIADGGSTDGTVKVIKEYIKKGAPIKLIHAPGNRSIGRNAAISASNNEIIAVTDVGCRADKDWLAHITKPLREKESAMMVAGNFKPEPETYFERVSSRLMLHANDDIDIKTWLPSSRSIAFKKEAWQKAGGYPEHTNFNEDTPFDLALKAAGYHFEDGLDAIVYWRPRKNLSEFYNQYFWYAAGDGLDNINIATISKLSARYLLTISLLIISAIFWPLGLLVLLPLLWFEYWGKIKSAMKTEKGAKTALLMIFLMVTFEVSQILGFWKGFLQKKKLRSSTKLVR